MQQNNLLKPKYFGFEDIVISFSKPSCVESYGSKISSRETNLIIIAYTIGYSGLHYSRAICLCDHVAPRMRRIRVLNKYNNYFSIELFHQHVYLDHVERQLAQLSYLRKFRR